MRTILINIPGYGFTQINPISIAGCLDETACNYNPNATETDDSCIYPAENYNCNGNCIAEIDCAGECGGSKIEDECSVCDGYGGCDCADGNISCYCCCPEEQERDCAGVCGGPALDDECGICGGSGIPDGKCDCNGNVDLGCGCGEAGPSGCDETCGSTLENDACCVCGGAGPAENYDCAGQCITIVDCNGLCGGTIVEDACGICEGGETDVNNCLSIFNHFTVTNQFKIQQIYPNPFNPVLNITFDIAWSGVIRVDILDISGNHIKTLHSGFLKFGSHEMSWNAESMPSGVYFISLNLGDKSLIEKVVLLK